MADAVRQHASLAMGKGLQGSSGEASTKRYAKGGAVKAKSGLWPMKSAPKKKGGRC